METKFKATCDICGEPVRGADTEDQLNRNIGLHKRSKHGIKGRENERYLRELARGMREHQKKKRGRPRKNPLPEASEPKPEIRILPTVKPCLLDHCPACNARFYISTTQ